MCLTNSDNAYLSDNLNEAVEVLQQLGLKEYEAKCFAGLSLLSSGTAKQVNDTTDVPRTRVYDAIRSARARRDRAALALAKAAPKT